MMLVYAENAAMGISCLDGNGVFSRNCCSNPSISCGVLISGKPVFGFALNIRKAKQLEMCGVLRNSGCGNIRALSKGDMDKLPVGAGILEKEFPFTSSFDGYLKAMESLRNGEEMRKLHKSDRERWQRPRDDDDDDTLEKDRNNVKFRKLESHSQQEGKCGNVGKMVFSGNGNSSNVKKVGGWDGLQKVDEWESSSVKGYAGNVQNLVQRKTKDKERSMNVKLKMNLGGETVSGRKFKYLTNTATPQSYFRLEDIREQERKGQCFASESQGKRMDLSGQPVRVRNHVRPKNVTDRKTALENRNITGHSDDLSEEGDSEEDIERATFKNSEEFCCVDVRNPVQPEKFTDRKVDLKSGNMISYGDPFSKEADIDMDIERTNFNNFVDPRNHVQPRKVTGRKIAPKGVNITRHSDHFLEESNSAVGIERETFNDFEEFSNEGVRNHVQRKKVTSRKIAPKSVNIRRPNDNFFEEDDSDEGIERASFKNFTELNNGLDGPQISRRELEERIQHLANSLNGADINIPEWVFSKMMRNSRIKFTDHSMSRVIQVLGKLGNWRRILHVIEWMQLKERFKSYRTRFIYTTALNELKKARRPIESLKVFYAMQQHRSSYPDLVSYRCIAVTLGQAGLLKELFDVIDCMRSRPKKKLKTRVFENWDPRLEPDIIVYNAVLNACVKQKHWEGAFWVLQQLKEEGQKPSSSTYGLVMEVMHACEKYSLVHEFFRKAQKSSIPNAFTYKVLVNTLWREGKIDEAVLAVQKMERRGIVGSAALYYDLARCLCSVGRCREALTLVEKICRVANKPLVVTYTGLIQACLDSGNVQNGAYMFQEMHKFCHPNVITCNVMVKAYVDHEMFEDVNELLHMMLEDGNHISSNYDYKFRVIPDTYTFNTLLDAYIVKRRWDDFEFVYEQMLNHGYQFNSKRHLHMILGASRAGQEELLETTWKHLVQANRFIPPSLVKERFCTKLGKGDFSAAISCITSHISGFGERQYSKKAWLNLLKENTYRFRNDYLGGFIDALNILSSRNELLNPALQELMASCEEFYRTRMIVSLPEPESLSIVDMYVS